MADGSNGIDADQTRAWIDQAAAVVGRQRAALATQIDDYRKCKSGAG